MSLKVGRCPMEYQVNSLKLRLEFKEPGKFKKVKLQKYVINYKWREDETRINFLERCADFLMDKEGITQTATDMVKEYFKGKEDNTYEKSLEEYMFSAIKSSKRVSWK